MKKRGISVCLLLMLGMLSACGSTEPTVNITTAAPEEQVEATATEEVTENPEVTEEVAQQDTQQAAQSSETKQETTTVENKATAKPDNSVSKATQAPTPKTETLEGEFYGFADGTSVEISVDGTAGVYRVGTNDVNEVLGNLEEGSVIIFEVEKVGDIQTITHVFQ